MDFSLMQDWLAYRAQVSPGKPALIFENETWSYARLNQAVAALCARLAAAGVQPGQHVAALLPNCPAFVFAIHALARLGAVIVPLNTRLTVPELAWQLGQSDAALLLCSNATAATVAELDIPAVNLDSAGPATPSPELPLFKPDALQGIIYTSGTTGQPKGAMLTFDNHFYSATASAFRLGTLPTDRWLLCMPLYHVGGLAIVLRCCLYGSAVSLLNRFDAATVAETLQSQPITLVSLVPTMLQRLLINDVNTLQSRHLRCILIGGAALTPQLAELSTRQKLPVAATYGLSEAASQVATAAPDRAAAKPGSVGKPLMFTRVRLLDAAGTSVPAGQIGEIAVSGPTVMRGYYNQPAATAHALRNGELITGDLGYLDSDGDLWVVQRRADLIVTGGENVYPAEVEAVLRRHPAVIDVCVAGIPDAEWGQRVAAAVQLAVTPTASRRQLADFCRQHLAGYKTPRFILFVDALPQTASGKVRRDAVQRQLVQAASSEASS